MNHILVIGGSGMLAGVCDYYVDQGYTVTVLSRTKSKKAFQNPALKWMACDYTSSAFREEMIYYLNHHKIDELVIWIHQSGHAQFEWLLEYLEQFPQIIIRHVRGSLAYKSLLNNEPSRGHQYYQYILGKVSNEIEERWLNNDEISNGIIQGIISGEQTVLVGHF